MLYTLLKYYVRLGMKLYCRRITVNDRAVLQSCGPLLIACNHPNSFLDAILLDILFGEPIHSLARGDAFINKAVAAFFRAVKIYPVYRTSEGAGNLQENYRTFDTCMELFREGKIVLIFSEGLCVNEWHLRPLKKGTARLAYQAWSQGIPLRILPTGINYSSFIRTGKSVHILFGKTIDPGERSAEGSEGQRYLEFNDRLTSALKQLVYEIAPEDKQRKAALLTTSVAGWKKLLLSPFGAAGWLVHTLLYYPIRAMVKKRYGKTGHYDSVVFLALLLFYPFYLLAVYFITKYLTDPLSASAVFALFPFLAWCHIQTKKELDDQ